MNIRRKYFLLIIFVVFSAFIFFQFVKIQEINLEGFQKDLIKEGIVKKEDIGDENNIKDFYGINLESLDEFVYFPPATNMEAKEILLVKSKEDYIEDNFAKIEKRVLNQEESFKNYSPDQFKILEKRHLEVSGDYIILIVDEKVELIKKILVENYR